jgi:hypothetical protein
MLEKQLHDRQEIIGEKSEELIEKLLQAKRIKEKY